jgi:fatty-acyl-CoA synthase
MVIGNLAGLAHGATLVFPGEAFDAEATLATVHRERCTVLHGVPTMFVAMIEAPGFARHDLSSLRTGVMAGAPCPIELMRKVIDRMHMAQITIAYGMTETAPISFQSAVDDPLERRVSTVGRVHPHVEVKIVDAAGETVPRGVKGELLTRGYSVMRGYWSDPARTAEAIDADGWMHSGDLATIDAEGYCNIVGRAKDMVIRGGENIYPREIEEYLHRHPAIQDVHVVGVPDERYGEELCAFVMLRAGHEASEAQLRDFCRGKIAHFKIPKHVRFVGAFPMTVSGKVRKTELRARIAEELGAHALATA